MWGISYPNLQMMMADSVAVLLHTDENGSQTTPGAQPRNAAPTPGTHTTPPMNFGEFLKKMHEIQDHRKQ